MIEFLKVDKKIDKILEIVDYEHIYKLVKDDKTIGYGTINKDKENMVFIFIEENSRGYGYGKMLFMKILEELKNKGFKEIKVVFKKENMQMLKIVTGVGGLHLSSLGENVKYVVPIK